MDTLWVVDHLLQADPTAPPGDTEMLEVYTTLGFLAARHDAQPDMALARCRVRSAGGDHAAMLPAPLLAEVGETGEASPAAMM